MFNMKVFIRTSSIWSHSLIFKSKEQHTAADGSWVELESSYQYCVCAICVHILHGYNFIKRTQETLAWRIPWTEEPDGLQFTGSHRVGHD